VVPSRRGTGILNLSTSCSKFSTFAASGALKVQETKGVVSHLAAGSGKGNVPFFLDSAYPVYPQPVGILRKIENSKIRKTKTWIGKIGRTGEIGQLNSFYSSNFDI
jgi:hypothetical protein